MSIEEKLHEIAAQANSSEKADVFSSVLGMVSTIIQDGRIEGLDKLLKFGFPEYYVKD